MTEEERRLIKEAVEAGRVTKIRPGVTVLLDKPKKETQTRWDPRFCDKGERTERSAHLDELDEDE